MALAHRGIAMDRNNAKDYLPLVQALAEGKMIQISAGEGFWTDIHNPNFGGNPDDYRIKPEPREVWVNRYADGTDGLATYSTEESAKSCGPSSSRAIRYREVIE